MASELILMSNNSERISKILSEKRIKQHVFEPSMRKIWTVVGKNEEHWISPEDNFCSCKGFYFANLEDETCYHLEAIDVAKNSGDFDTIKFSDDEFLVFVKSLISEIGRELK